MVAPPDRLPPQPITDAELDAYLEQCAFHRALLGALTLDLEPTSRDWHEDNAPIDVSDPELHPLTIAFGDLERGALLLLPSEVHTDDLELWLFAHGLSIEVPASEWPVERYMLYVAALNRAWTDERARRCNPGAAIAPAPLRTHRPAAETTTERRPLPADRTLARLECDRLFHRGLSARVRA